MQKSYDTTVASLQEYRHRGVILEELQVVYRNRQPIRRLDSTHLTLAGHDSQPLGYAKIVRYDSRKPSRTRAQEGYS